MILLIGIKRKDTFEEKREKRNAKKSRNATLSNTQVSICTSCNNTGHSSSRSKECPNHNFTLQELLERNFGSRYQRYTVSLPLKSFVRTADEDAYNEVLEKIKNLSTFLREVVFKAQFFINFYILKHPNNLTNDFFQQNFWYSICRVVNKRFSIQQLQSKYSHILFLEETWTELSGIEDVDLMVEQDNLKNYGQVLSAACQTMATCYNNYYIEGFQNIVANYFIYMVRDTFWVSEKLKKHLLRILTLAF